MSEKPFWEAIYEDPNEAAAFGAASDEIIALANEIPAGARVLDLGCGDGRNALFLASRGLDVTAIDVSEAGIAKLERRAEALGLEVRTRVEDMRSYVFDGEFDLIVAHGCLHLIERHDWMRVVAAMKEHTRTGGYNDVVVFTDTIPPPDDLRAFHVGLFREGELFDLYCDWDTVDARCYILEDEHPGNIRHRHPINRLVARKGGL